MRHFSQAYPQTGENDPATLKKLPGWSPWDTTMAEIGEFQRLADQENRWIPTTINCLDKTQRNRRLAPIPQPGEVSSMDYGTSCPGPWRDRYSLRRRRVDDIFAQEGRKVLCKEWNLAKTSTGQSVYMPSWREGEKTTTSVKSCLKPVTSSPASTKTCGEPADLSNHYFTDTSVASLPAALTSSSGCPEAIHLPDINSLDVQLLTNRNEVIGVQNESKQIQPYSFPRGINRVPVPDIKDVNVSFAMQDGRRVNVRATPQPPK